MSQTVAAVTAETPALPGQSALGPLDSRYVDVAGLPWKPTQVKGIDMKILLQDKTTGLLTALFRWQPGTRLPLHEHVEIEQSYLLEGSLVDDEGECTAGNFVWRPKGNRHDAYSPNGALVLAIFLRPNVFLEGFPGQTIE
jgi:anti-sigma factor ChrR (cupin superfamily)